jgi:hypothetical protein
MNAAIQTILREAQIKINQVASGYRVVLIEAERTGADVQSDVRHALRDRQDAGVGADDHAPHVAPLTLDGASREERDLIEAALRDLSVVADLEK